VTSIALSVDGRRGISTSRDQTIQVWDLDTGKRLQTLRGHVGEVHAVTLSTDGTIALSGGEDCTARVWDLVTGECVAVYFAGDEVRSVSQLWPGRRFACGTSDGQIHALAIRNAFGEGANDAKRS
jgi:WD40 repeat protein